MPRRGKANVSKASSNESLQNDRCSPMRSVTKRLRKAEASEPNCIGKSNRRVRGSEKIHISDTARVELAAPEPDFAALADIDLNEQRTNEKTESIMNSYNPLGENLTPKKSLSNLNGYEQLPESPLRDGTKEGIPAFPMIRRAVARVAPAMWKDSEISNVVVQTKTPMRGIQSSDGSEDEQNCSGSEFNSSRVRQDESGPMDSPVRSYSKPSPPRSQSPMRLSPMKFPPTPVINNSKYWTGEKIQTIDDEENIDPKIKQAPSKATVKRRLRSCMGSSYMTIDEICEMTCNPLSPVILEPPLLYLSLPTSLRALNECFKSVLVVMCTSSESGLEVIFKKNFIQMVQKMMNNRRLTLIEIQQILWLVPSLIEAKWVPSKDSKDYELKLINKKLPGEMKLGRLDSEYRRKIFRSMLVLWTALHHDAVLVSMNPPIKPPARESMQGWHPDFELEQVSLIPTMKLSPKPQRHSSVSPSKRLQANKFPYESNEVEDQGCSILPPSLRRRHTHNASSCSRPKEECRDSLERQSIFANASCHSSPQNSLKRSPSPINFKTDSMIKLRDRADKLRVAKEIRDKLSREEEELFNEMQERADMIRVLESIHAYFGQSTTPRVVLLPILVTYISRLPLRPPINADQGSRAIKMLQDRDPTVISLSESTTFPNQMLVQFSPAKNHYTKLLNTCHDELNSSQKSYSECRRNIPNHFKQIWVERTLTEEPRSFGNNEIEAWASCPTPFRGQKLD